MAINGVGPELDGQYKTALRLLKQLQVDYRLTRKELDDVSLHFKEREAIAGKHLHTALNAIDMTRIDSESTMASERRDPPLEQSLTTQRLAPHLAKQQFVPRLEAYYLGRFQVSVGWKRIDHWHSTKAKSVLKYLLAQQGKPVSKDVLMEAIWPGGEPALANSSLKSAVHSLRQMLSLASGTDDNFLWIVFHEGNYCINSAVDLWLDVEQFEYHWRTGLHFEKEGKLDEAFIQHETAEAMYKGEYLEDDLYKDWTSLPREALKDIYLTIVGRLADYSMLKEDHIASINYCQKILAKDPCREDAYQRLMCCYCRLGQRNRAIAWYHICERTIKRELNVSPARATVDIYDKLLSDENL